MVFDFASEQLGLRSAARSFLDATSSEADVRRLMDSPVGYDDSVWQRMAAELGLQGLVIPEQYGGSGGGMVELAIVLEEMGRRLLCAPYLATVSAALAVLKCGDQSAAAEFLPGIADGTTIATLAVAEDCGRWGVDAVECVASADGQAVLDGVKNFVVDGALADLLIVAARGPDGVALYAVDARAPGLARTALPTFDRTRRLARLEFSQTPARLLGEAHRGGEVLAGVLDLIRVAVSAENVGAAEFVLNMSLDYAKQRVQFGRAIGSFQAIKHLCADTLLDVESARSAAYFAAWAAADNTDELPAAASLAKAFTADTLLQTASANIQIHGGIAFTWEHPAHLYYRRAKSATQLFGDSFSHRELLAVQLGL